jgi:hypothetical protein
MERSSSGSGLLLDLEAVDIARFNFKGRCFYFKSKWAREAFQLDITDGRQLWSGGLSSPELSSFCPKNMTLKEYASIVRKVCFKIHLSLALISP